MRDSKLKPPTLLFPDTLIFDDGKHRVELRHFGTAHTKGTASRGCRRSGSSSPAMQWSNGPYNFLGDGDTAPGSRRWPRCQRSAPSTVGPGHGPLGQASVIQDQQTFFRELRRVVQAASTQSPAAVQAAIPSMRDELRKNAEHCAICQRRLAGQVGKVYTELTGRTLPDRQAELDAERTHVAWHHGHAHAPGQ